MSAHQDRGPAADAALLLLKLAGATSVHDASHVAVALTRHRNAMRLEGSGISSVVVELERVFATVAMGSRGVTSGQQSAGIDQTGTSHQRGPHDDHLAELLTREQVSHRLRCSVATVKRRERAGLLTPVRHGRVVRHRREDIDRLINEGAQ